MPVYRYVAANDDGSTIKGKLTASNELDLEERLSDLELVVLEYSLVKPKKSTLFSKISTKELIMLCIHLEQLDKAGVPLLDSLADMRDSADSPIFRDLMADIYESVKGGDVLSLAMSKRPDVFNDVFIGLISAGEKTGKMSEAFEHLAEHLKWNSDFTRTIRKALSYPIGLVIVMSIVLTLMMMMVVPQLVDYLTSQGFDLPIHTRALIATSDAFADYWYLILGTPALFIFATITMHRTSPSARYTIDSLLLKIPAVGNVILKINLSRFTRFFAITFGSGIDVLDCLSTAKNVVGNTVMKEAVDSIIKNVSEGSSITRAISSTERFPSLVVRMFKVGEDSGNMDEALKNINFFYDREVADSVARMTGLIQPTLTIFMGAIIFWIIAAVFGPLYETFSALR